MQQQAKQQAQAQLRYSVLSLLFLTIREISPYKSTKHVVIRGRSEVGKRIFLGGGNQTLFIKLYMSHDVRKPVFVVSDQVRHKPGCTATQDGYKLEISDLESRRLVLSM